MFFCPCCSQRPRPRSLRPWLVLLVWGATWIPRERPNSSTSRSDDGASKSASGGYRGIKPAVAMTCGFLDFIFRLSFRAVRSLRTRLAVYNATRSRMNPQTGNFSVLPQQEKKRAQRARGRRRRPERRGAPPQAADSRCAKLNAIFGSALLPLISKSSTMSG